jgi:RND family efflux transporter MFP subunit
MKKLIIAGIALIMVSCAPKESTDKKAELQEYKELVKEYNEKIAALEIELDSTGALNGEEIRSTSVEVKPIQTEEFTSYFEAKGSVESLKDAFISPEISGQIKSIDVDRGERVKKGAILVKLKTDVTQSSIKEVKTSLELATKIFGKQEQLWNKKIGSEIQYLEAKNAKESLEARLATLESQLEMATIRAPFDGIVDNIMVKTGELASPGMRLMRLVNIDDLRITAEISESFLTSVHVGEDVSLSFSSYPDLSIKESIHRIGTVIDPITRTFTIEVILKNRDEMLKPNMLSTLSIQDYFDKDALLVPSIILKQDFKGTFLFIVKEEGSKMFAKKVYVKTGKTVQDITKITEGIKLGDKVIIKGYNLVTDGEAVTVLN